MTISNGNKIAIPLIAIGIIILVSKLMSIVISIAHSISEAIK